MRIPSLPDWVLLPQHAPDAIPHLVFHPDEYALTAEVIRFSKLDFRQHFFDIPGTPFITINALIWGFLQGGNQMPLLFAVMRRDHAGWLSFCCRRSWYSCYAPA